MAAITWRNIDAPDLRSSIQGMTLAQQGFQRGLDSLQGILDQQAKTDQANWEQVKKNNTDELKNLLFNAKTPEEAAAIQSQIAERLTAMGAQVDANAVRSAVDARVPELQRRALETIDYNNKQTDAKDAPILNEIKAIALKDPILAASMLANPKLSDRGRLAAEQSLRDLTRQDVQWDREGKKFAWEGQDHENKNLMAPLERDAKRAAIAASNASAKASGVDGRYKEALIRKIDDDIKSSNPVSKAIEARRKEELSKLGWGSGGATSPEGRKAIDEELKNIKDYDVRNNITNQMSDLITNGLVLTGPDGKSQRVPLSADMVIQAIRGTSNEWGVGNWHGERAVDWLKSNLVNPKTANPELVRKYLDGYSIYSRTGDGVPSAMVADDGLQSPDNSGDRLLDKGYPSIKILKIRESLGFPLTEEQKKRLKANSDK